MIIGTPPMLCHNVNPRVKCYNSNTTSHIWMLQQELQKWNWEHPVNIAVLIWGVCTHASSHRLCSENCPRRIKWGRKEGEELINEGITN